MIAMLKDPNIWAQFLALLMMLPIVSHQIDVRRLTGFSGLFLAFLFVLGWVFSRQWLVINYALPGISWRDVLTLVLAAVIIVVAFRRMPPRHPLATAALAVPLSLCVADHLELMVLALLTTLSTRAISRRSSIAAIPPALHRPVLAVAGLVLALHALGIQGPRIMLGWLLAATYLASILNTLARRPSRFRNRSGRQE